MPLNALQAKQINIGTNMKAIGESGQFILNIKNIESSVDWNISGSSSVTLKSEENKAAPET